MTVRYLEKFTEIMGSPTLAPTFVGTGSAVTGDGGTPHTFTHHVDTKEGDFKVAFFYSRNTSGGSVTAVSDGWTTVYNDLGSGGFLVVMTKFHEFFDGPLVLTVAGHATGASGDSTLAQMATFRGVSHRRPIAALGTVSTNGSQANIGAIAGITLPAAALLLVVAGKADDWTSVATLAQSGLTFAEIGDNLNTSGADNGLVWDYATADDGAQVAITDKTFSVTGGGSAVGKGVMFALNPGIGYTFPLKRYECEDSQPVRTAYGQAAGASYAHDYLGGSRSPKANGRSTVRFFDLQASAGALDTDIDKLRSRLYEIGLGKLWTLGDDGTRRWAYARLEALPEISVQVGNFRHMPTSAQFARLSDWRDADLTTVTKTVTAATDYLDVTNPGNATVYDAVIRIRSNSSAGFTNPVITNLMTGETFSTTRDAASSSDELKIDCGELTAEYSTNDGSSYADDLAAFSRGSEQVVFMTFPPGQSRLKIEIGGTPNCDVSVSLRGAYS